jgi:drug/metabolite transporter (DMT)-like permease
VKADDRRVARQALAGGMAAVGAALGLVAVILGVLSDPATAQRATGGVVLLAGLVSWAVAIALWPRRAGRSKGGS